MTKITGMLLAGLLVSTALQAQQKTSVFATYQDASDGDAGMGGGAGYSVNMPSIHENVFLEGRLGYLTGFGSDSIDVTVIPIEVGLGYTYEIDEKLTAYGLALLGYYIADIEGESSRSGIYWDGREISSGSTTSYDIDNGVGFNLSGGIEYALTDQLTFFGEIGFRILELDASVTTTGGRATRVGNLTITPPSGGTYEESSDLGGLNATVGIKILL